MVSRIGNRLIVSLSLQVSRILIEVRLGSSAKTCPEVRGRLSVMLK